MSQAIAQRPPVAPTLAGALLRVFALPVAGFLGFGLAIALGLPSDRIALLGVAIVLMTVILSFVALDRLRPRERRNLLISILSFMYLVLFVVPVFVFYLGGTGYTPEASPNPIPLTPRAVTWGEIAALVAFVMLLAGYLLPVGAAVARFVPQMRREWSLGTGLTIALAIIPLGWAVRLAGDLGLIPERAGSGALGAAANFTNFGVALLALCYHRYRSRGALALMCILIPPSVLFGFFTGSKSMALLPLVMVAVVHIVVTRRLRAWWIAGFLALMSLFYPISEIYRNYAWVRGLSAIEVITNPSNVLRLIEGFTSATTTAEQAQVGLESTSHRLNGLGILSVVVRDAGNRVPFQGGWTLTYVPLSYIPRLIWPGKPKFMTGQWVTDHFGSGPHVRSSTAATWIGEFYYNFGWTGVVLGMMTLGVWFRFLQESFLGPHATTPAMFAGVVSIVGLCTGMEGDMIGATNSVVFNVAPIVLAHLLVCAFMPAPAPARRPL